MTLDDTTKQLFAEYGRCKHVDKVYKENPYDPSVIDYVRTIDPGILALGQGAYIDALNRILPPSIKTKETEMSHLDRKDVYKQIKEDVDPKFEGADNLQYWAAISASLKLDLSKDDSLKEVVSYFRYKNKLLQVLKGSRSKEEMIGGLYALLEEEQGLTQDKIAILDVSRDYNLNIAAQKIAIKILEQKTRSFQDKYMKEVEKDGKKEKVVDTEKYAKDAESMEKAISEYVAGNDKDNEILFTTYSSMLEMKDGLEKEIKQREKAINEAKKEAEEKAKKA